RGRHTGRSAGAAMDAADSTPPALPDEQLTKLAAEVSDYALAHGMAFGVDGTLSTVMHTPMTLLPTPFPASLFELVHRLQPTLQRVMHRYAHDRDFMVEALSSIRASDLFTARLCAIYD